MTLILEVTKVPLCFFISWSASYDIAAHPELKLTANNHYYLVLIIS